MNFNLKRGLAGALVALSFLPVIALAEGGTNTSSTTKVPTNFCVRISSLQSKLTDQITNTEAKQLKNQTDRANKIAKREGDVDAKRAKGRTDVDSRRLKNWDKMTEKAKTDAQKAAVEAYKTAIGQAVTNRRASVDAAVKAYRDGLGAAMSGHSSTITEAIALFKTSVNNAVIKAEADCAANVDNKTVKETFNKSVSDARKVLQAARKEAEMSAGLLALKKTRDDGIRAAELAFKTAVDKAHADLVLGLK